MTKEQVSHIFSRLVPVPGSNPPSYYVAVLLNNGTAFDGHAFAIAADKMLQIDVPRIADAHVSKPPLTVLVDMDSIAAITSYAAVAPV